MKIKVFKDFAIHWTDIKNLEDIILSGTILEGSAFSDNPDFGIHSPNLWNTGLVFRKIDIKPYITLEEIVKKKYDIISKRDRYPLWLVEVAEKEPDTPFWKWEREIRILKDVSLSKLKLIVYRKKGRYVRKRDIENILKKFKLPFIPILEIDKFVLSLPEFEFEEVEVGEVPINAIISIMKRRIYRKLEL